MNPQQQDAIRKLAEMIKDVRYAMLTTIGPDGTLHGRPMATQDTEFDGELWFFTDAHSHKVEEVDREHQVSVSYASPEQNSYVAVAGTADLVREPEKLRELWKPALKAWFPKGLDDPNLALLRVRVERAEYWDSASSKMVQLVGFAKAIVTGKRYEGTGTKHGTIDLGRTPAPTAR